MQTRRRSRPWLSLWESFERSEPERAQAVASLRIDVVIATGYPLCLDYNPPSNRVTSNGVGQLPGSQSRIASGCNPSSQS